MRKTWFYRMLFSYMPVFLAVCLTLLLILFLTVRQLSERSSMQSNETVAKNASQLLDQTLRGIEDGMFMLVNSDPNIQGFYADPYKEAYSRPTVYQTALALRDMQARFPILKTLYLVNPEENSVVEPTGIATLSDYPDRTYIRSQISSDTRYRWGDRRAVPSNSSVNGSADVISISRIANLRTKGLLVAQIDVQVLQQLLSQSVDVTTGYLRLTDAKGLPFASTPLPDGAGQEPKKLASVEMAYTGWTVESGVLQPGILNWAEPVLYVSISIGGICMFFGLVWFVLATRRHYRPVQNLIRQIGAFSMKKPPESAHEERRDEFQTIGRALNHLWDHSNRLMLENEENLKIRQEHHFRRLAEGRFDGASFYGRREEELFGLKLEAGRPTAIRIEIDRFAQWSSAASSLSEEDRHIILSALQAGLEEQLAQNGYSYAVNWLSEQQLGAIVMQPEGADAGIGLIAAMEQVRTWTETQLPFTVTIAAGVSVDRIEAVSISFQTAARALGFKLSLGGNRFIPLSVLPDAGDPDLIQELERIEEISRSLRMGETEWEHELTQLSSALSSRLFDGQQVRNLLNVLLFHVQHKMSDLPAELDGMWQTANARLMISLKEGESLAELTAALKAALGAMSEQIRLWRDSKMNRGVVQEIKRYIDGNYADPNLSQTMLSEAFRLHSSSISRLFKEEFGVKFVDYINGVRVEQALLLMEREDLPVHMVAERVGFMHSKTFIQVFKKITGSTPGMYRKERTGS